MYYPTVLEAARAAAGRRVDAEAERLISEEVHKILENFDNCTALDIVCIQAGENVFVKLLIDFDDGQACN